MNDYLLVIEIKALKKYNVYPITLRDLGRKTLKYCNVIFFHFIGVVT